MNYHQVHDNEDSEVRFAPIQHIIVALIETLTLPIKNDKKGHLTWIKREEDKVNLEDFKNENLGNSCNDNSLPSYSNIPFKIESKLEIPTYDSQVNVEKHNRQLQ